MAKMMKMGRSVGFITRKASLRATCEEMKYAHSPMSTNSGHMLVKATIKVWLINVPVTSAVLYRVMM